jgi:hypothetical protein
LTKYGWGLRKALDESGLEKLRIWDLEWVC